MKHITTILAFLTLLGLAAMPALAAERVHKGQGAVNSVDAKANKVNLTHGPIATLKWPGMTMDFQVRDQAVLKGVTPGQDVEFDIVQAGQSQFIITRIAPAAKK